MHGKDVALLQERLVQLNYVIPDDERIKEFFGKATRSAVTKFQSEYNLNPNGIVDKSTSRAIDKFLSKNVSSSYDSRPAVSPAQTKLDKQDDVPSTPPIKDHPITERMSVALLKPNVLFGTLLKLNGLDRNQKAFISARLNESLQYEILKRIGKVSDSMNAKLKPILEIQDYHEIKNLELSRVVLSILSTLKAKNTQLANEISEIEQHLASAPSETIADLLHLNTSLENNPIFYSEIQKAKTLQYSKLSNLTVNATKRLIQKDIDLDYANSKVFANLVKEGICNNKEMENLRLTVDLAKLTGHNISLIKALRTEELRSVADLVTWQKADWHRLITEEKIPLPPEETSETYAEAIVINIERTYPSQVLLSRLNDIPQIDTIWNSIDILSSSLLENNDKLIDNENDLEINWRGIGAENRERMQNYLQEISAFANTYRHLGVAELINDKELSAAEKEDKISKRLHSLHTFYKNNPSFDLRFANFFETEEEKFVWKEIVSADRPLVRRQLMEYGRALHLTGDVTNSLILLGQGYGSSVAIADKTEEEFIRTSGLDAEDAHMVYDQAMDSNTYIAHSIEAIRDVVRGQFKDIHTGNLDPKLINGLQKIHGFDSFFGNQDYCECEECKSILSPSAYFVDLMRFIEENVSNTFFLKESSHHPLYLKNRRPDLWTLPLTCENTSTLVPYLTIVNEVLESYLSREVVSGDIFKELSKSSLDISFAFPFNLPLEELRIYLSHFGLDLSEIYDILKQPEEKIMRAKINMSQEELTIISQDDPASAVFRFGNRPSLDNFPVQDFIRLAGLTREELTELLATQYNPDISKKISVGKELTPDELQNFPEILRSLTPELLDYIHRFIRLWRKTPWKISELDLVLVELKKARLIKTELKDPAAILYVAQLIDIQKKLDLAVEELYPMFHSFPEWENFPQPHDKLEERNLFEELFDIRTLFEKEDPITHKFKFHRFVFPSDSESSKGSDPLTPAVLGGLGISETELLMLFDLLQSQIKFLPAGYYDIGLSEISLLYRHARLSKALGLKIEDFIQILRFNSKFAENYDIRSLDQINEVYNLTGYLKSSLFSISEIRFILKDEESNSVKHAIKKDALISIVKNIQQSKEIKDAPSALHVHLSKLLNVTSGQLSNMLRWVLTDIRGEGIKKALEATFDRGILVNDSQLDALVALVKELERVLLLFSKLEFKPDTISYLTANPRIVGIANLKQLTLDNLKSLESYHKLITLNEEAEQQPIQTILNDFDITKPFANKIISIADFWKQDQGLIRSLIQSLNFVHREPAPGGGGSADKTNAVEAVEYLLKCLDVCLTLGINGFSLQKLAADDNYKNLFFARDVVVGAFRSKYPEEKIRIERLEPYQDKINVIKRDVLCDYIIARKEELRFKDMHDIYAFFLLDVEMGGCSRISRLVCAISSLQLYVHRCLFNLEQTDPNLFVLRPGLKKIDVDPKNIPTVQWTWRKNYRVWEANRKVYLFCENYCRADLRDNKTPLFKALEDELLQKKITKESVEEAYKKYLSQFAELARLIIIGSYYDEASRSYYLVGCSQRDPKQYYYRIWAFKKKLWTPWEKIELGISSNRVAPIIYRGTLYIFWTERKSSSSTTTNVGSTGSTTVYKYTKDLAYSFLNEQGKWHPVQKTELLVTSSEDHEWTPSIATNTDIVIPIVIEKEKNKEVWIYVYDALFGTDTIGFKMDFFRNKADQYAAKLDTIPANTALLKLHWPEVFNIVPGYKFRLTSWRNPIDSSQAEMEVQLWDSTADGNPPTARPVTEWSFVSWYHPDLHQVGYGFGDYILKFGDQQYLIKRIKTPSGYSTGHTRKTYRVSTSLGDILGDALFSKGLESFLSFETQLQNKELATGIAFTNEMQLLGPFDNPDHIDFSGAFGEYYREIFFHIPHLIASSCNANGKFKEAEWWYQRIFDPTAPESPDEKNPNERNWRYIEFRNQTVEKMKDILTNTAAIEQYRENPFNPHAIARLRLGAYQKAIIMEVINNYLDWGDHLFAQDTIESINEAEMLYVMASDILGARPVKLGKCKTYEDVTYHDIKTKGKKGGSEFLILLESWNNTNAMMKEIDENRIAQEQMLLEASNTETSLESGVVVGERDSASAAADDNDDLLASSLEFEPSYNIESYNEVLAEKNKSKADNQAVRREGSSPADSVVKQIVMGFCVPPNYDLLKYWDRVEDRLFKIRNCMNISGRRRQLALFQPPIDPLLLVRARAAGLSLEEITELLASPLPPYRFTYMLQKARQFTQGALHNFGSSLLSALEKKDVEELTRLRALHEKNILRMTTEIKKQQLTEAQYQLQAIDEAKKNVENRKNYYQLLITNGPSKWEGLQRDSTHAASFIRGTAATYWLVRSIIALMPQVGSPFSLNYGGVQLKEKAGALAYGAENAAKLAEVMATSAGLEATFERRDQEWAQQLKLATQEVKEVDKRRSAAEIRVSISEKDLEIHRQNIENYDELNEFYKNKFTNLGLYNYLSTTLNRLYRQSYMIAYDLALMAEQAYKFEREFKVGRDESVRFISNDNWQFDKAGLLAGERLLLQLDQMEKAYLEKDKRDYEITQSFSLALVNAMALVDLRQKGKCTFEIPEVMFDLFYPGQYNRIIKSVRITIPCVTGPYSNVSAKLTFERSQIRREASLDSKPPVLEDGYTWLTSPLNGRTSIATSNAQSDSGMFELNFRDERYLPFEGAGAVNSRWNLELPSKIRSFDYDTISDIILHISYTANDGDDGFKDKIEDQIFKNLTSLAKDGLFKLISLKHDFPTHFHQLLNPAGETRTTKFEIKKNHFPYFLNDKKINLSSSVKVKVFLKSRDKNPRDTSKPKIKINGVETPKWKVFSDDMWEAEVSISGGDPIKEWTVDAGVDGLDKEVVDDLFILLKYTAASNR